MYSSGAQEAPSAPRTDQARSELLLSPLSCYLEPTTPHAKPRRVSAGGEVRDAYERFHSPNFALAPPNPGGYFLERALVCADARLETNVRVFLALESSLEYERAGGPRPFVDRDELDGLAGYLEVSHSLDGGRIAIRAGRQELALGSGRMVALREGVNTRGPFDGLRISVSKSQFVIDGFILRPDLTNPGVFNDTPDHQTLFWGIYGTAKLLHPSFDAYYLGYDQKRAAFDQGVGHEVRQTFGARLFETKTKLPFDIEGVVQTGSFNGAPILAWRAAGQLKWPVSNQPHSLDFVLDVDAASGDKDPRDPALETFRAFYQSGTYSGRAQLLGCDNAVRLEPSFAFTLPRHAQVTGGWAWYWRESVHDGLYGIANNLIVPDHSIPTRYEGMRPIVQVDWNANRAISLHVNYIYVFNGAFEQESVHGSKSLSYVSPWIVYRF